MTRFSRSRPGRRRRKKRILVTGQGKETEPNYFRGLRDDARIASQFVVKVAPGKGETPLDAVRRAIELARRARAEGRDMAYDAVFCFLDVEQAGQNPHLDEARRLARADGVQVFLSNPAFEVWLLAHLERTAKAFLNGTQLLEYLEKQWLRAFGGGYEKNDPHLYARLGERLDTAIGNARHVRESHFRDEADLVHCNSATEVYRAVEFLLGRNSAD
jgi:hypothetical protein